MRFEIRAGGWLFIFIGLTALSAGVFVLGMVAGYEMAHQDRRRSDRLEALYPLPAPPLTVPAPSITRVAPKLEPVVSPAALHPASPAPTKARRARGPARLAASPAARVSRKKAPARIEPIQRKARPSSAGADAVKASAASQSVPVREASRIVVPAPKRKPYNIQIGASMDRERAEALMTRVQSLGYRAHWVTMKIDGQTWYRVQVGPYDTLAQAASARKSLREKYQKAFSRR